MSQDYSYLLKSLNFCDCTIRVINASPLPMAAPIYTDIPTHRTVLAARSLVFRGILEKITSPPYIIVISNYSLSTVKTLLNYLYVDFDLPTLNLKEQNLFEILSVADNYMLSHFKEKLESYIETVDDFAYMRSDKILDTLCNADKCRAFQLRDTALWISANSIKYIFEQRMQPSKNPPLMKIIISNSISNEEVNQVTFTEHFSEEAQNKFLDKWKEFKSNNLSLATEIEALISIEKEGKLSILEKNEIILDQQFIGNNINYKISIEGKESKKMQETITQTVFPSLHKALIQPEREDNKILEAGLQDMTPVFIERKRRETFWKTADVSDPEIQSMMMMKITSKEK